MGKCPFLIRSGGRGSLCMQDILLAILCLIDRVQRLLATYRLWLHEARGRLDSAFIRLASLHSLILNYNNRLLRAEGEFEEVRGEVSRTILNFNGRLEVAENNLEEGLEEQAALLQSFGARLQLHHQSLLLLGFILVLQLLRICAASCQTVPSLRQSSMLA